MVKVEDIQAKDFEGKISSEIPVVVEFWIKSCDNCRKFKPIYEDLSDSFNDLKFFRVNMFESVENLRLAEGLGVEETPTVKIFRKGKEIGKMIGFQPLEKAILAINKAIK